MSAHFSPHLYLFPISTSVFSSNVLPLQPLVSCPPHQTQNIPAIPYRTGACWRALCLHSSWWSLPSEVVVAGLQESHESHSPKRNGGDSKSQHGGQWADRKPLGFSSLAGVWGRRQPLTSRSLRSWARLRASRSLKPKFFSCSGSVTTYSSGGKKWPAFRD